MAGVFFCGITQYKTVNLAIVNVSIYCDFRSTVATLYLTMGLIHEISTEIS